MKKFTLIALCYPDYFTGYNRSVISVNMNPLMTNKDVADQLRLELSWIETDFSRTEYLIAQKYINELMNDPDEVFFRDNEVTPENCPEDYELYGYFSIINPVYKYGIMFLNP